MEPAEGLEKFFTRIWGTDHEGYVYLPTLEVQNDENRTRYWRPKFFGWPKKKDAVVEHVLRAESQLRDVYYSPVLYDLDKDKPEATKNRVIGTRWVWADFDGNAPKEWNSELIPPPSIRIATSVEGREHCYWELEQFQTDWTVAENFNRTIAAILNADSGGWDITQVLRPPYTTNFGRGKGNSPKEDREPTKVKYKDYRENRYGFDQFKIKPVASNAELPVDISTLPRVIDVIAKYHWDADNWELFQKDGDQLFDRSEAMMRLAFFGAEKGMTDSEIYRVLRHVDDRWEKFKFRPPDKRHAAFIDIITRAREKYPVAEILSFKGLLGTGSEEDVVIGVGTFLHREYNFDWMVTELLQKRGYGMIAAQPGVGKTQFSIQMGMHLALGEDFLGWKIENQHRVLLLSLEMAGPELQFILQKMTEPYSEQELGTLDEFFHILPAGESLPLLTDRGRTYLEYLIETHKPDIIIIDSLGQIIQKMDDSDVKLVSQYFQRIRVKYNLAVWLIHHNRKAGQDNKEPKELADVYGSQYIVAFPEIVMTLWEKGSEIELRILKNRLAARDAPRKLVRGSHLGFKLAGTDDVNIGAGLLSHIDSTSETSADDPWGLR